MILVIDNYDSFTFNLVHYLQQLGPEVEVVRNDALSVSAALDLQPEAVLLSPVFVHAHPPLRCLTRSHTMYPHSATTNTSSPGTIQPSSPCSP
jgi:hypothetical protein